jgi:hypothetical protein
LALAATIAAMMLWPVETAPTIVEDPAAEAPAEDAKPTAETTPDPQSIEAASDAPSETAAETEPTPAVPSARPARLTVVVFPWGDVWINGKPRGSAPLKNLSLKPGRYKVSAGQGQPSKTQTIRLRETQRKTVHFDLTK